MAIVVIAEFGLATFPVQFTNLYPVEGCAVSCTTVSEAYVPPLGVTVPASNEGLTDVVSVYTASKVAVTVSATEIVTLFVAEFGSGTLPVQLLNR